MELGLGALVGRRRPLALSSTVLASSTFSPRRAFTAAGGGGGTGTVGRIAPGQAEQQMRRVFAATLRRPPRGGRRRVGVPADRTSATKDFPAVSAGRSGAKVEVIFPFRVGILVVFPFGVHIVLVTVAVFLGRSRRARAEVGFAGRAAVGAVDGPSTGSGAVEQVVRVTRQRSRDRIGFHHPSSVGVRCPGAAIDEVEARSRRRRTERDPRRGRRRHERRAEGGFMGRVEVPVRR